MKLKYSSFTRGPGELQLQCPVCKLEFTHLKEARTTTVDDQLAIRLHFRCEKGHDFSHLIYNHDRVTMVTSGL